MIYYIMYLAAWATERRKGHSQRLGPAYEGRVHTSILNNKFTKFYAASFIEFLNVDAHRTTFEEIAQFLSTCFCCISNWERGSSWLCCRSGWNASYLPLNQTISAEVDFKISRSQFPKSVKNTQPNHINQPKSISKSVEIYFNISRSLSTKPYQPNQKPISKSISVSPKLYFWNKQFVLSFSSLTAFPTFFYDFPVSKIANEVDLSWAVNFYVDFPLGVGLNWNCKI